MKPVRPPPRRGVEADGDRGSVDGAGVRGGRGQEVVAIVQTELLRGEAGVPRAAALLRAGRLVAFPTETVYGLGADALNAAAVRAIFAAKGRPADNPLIVHLADRGQLGQVVARGRPGIDWRLVDQLAARFWPGPLTLVLPRSSAVPDEVTAGLDTVAVRVPAHPIAAALIAAAGVPVAAPSANAAGRPSPTRAEHVWADLDGRIDAILDGGPTGVGVESTVLDVSRRPYAILRPGGVAAELLEPFCGPLRAVAACARAGGEAAGQEQPRSPGLKYAHYAPRAPLTLVEGPPHAVRRRVAEIVADAARRGLRAGVLAAEERRNAYPGAAAVLCPGPAGDAVAWAANLYDRLRAFDQLGVDLVVAEGFSDTGLGAAIADRLRRAAGSRIERL